MCSNFYAQTPDGKCWLAEDRNRRYYMNEMKDGYNLPTILTEEEFREIYPLPITEYAY